MPFNSFSFANEGLSYGQRLLTVENKILTGVNMGPETVGTHASEYYGQILIISTDTPTPVPLILLASGHFGAMDFISWTGRIRMDPSYAIMARIWVDGAVPARCTVLVEDLP